MKVLLLFATILLLVSPAKAEFTEDHPSLKKFVFNEQDSRILFGFGGIPLSIVKNKAALGVSIFQVHWVKDLLDFELFNASFFSTISDTPTNNAKSFMFRMSPKIRVFKSLSVGPVAGLEFVNYPDVLARIGNSQYFTLFEPYSSSGFIFGAAAAQNLSWGEQTIRATQLVYRQGYSTVESSREGWNYFYEDMSLNRDQGPISPGWVFLVEFSLLY